jgi:glycogenin glucosyltransferase
MVGIDRVVYLDADTLVQKNFDELFDIPFNFAAVPDVYGDSRGFVTTFNTGVLVLHPNTAVLENMKKMLESAEFPPGEADQAFLNLYFGGKTLQLPYAYNANLAIKRRSLALWQGLREEMRVVHYTLVKPFLHETHTSTILTPEELHEAMTRAEEQYGGYFKVEVGWWREAYNRMMLERGNKISACSPE